MEAKGIEAGVVRWVESLLSDRTQRVFKIKYSLKIICPRVSYKKNMRNFFYILNVSEERSWISIY
jgi:hypothetical protein